MSVYINTYSDGTVLLTKDLWEDCPDAKYAVSPSAMAYEYIRDENPDAELIAMVRIEGSEDYDVMDYDYDGNLYPDAVPESAYAASLKTAGWTVR